MWKWTTYKPNILQKTANLIDFNYTETCSDEFMIYGNNSVVCLQTSKIKDWENNRVQVQTKALVVQRTSKFSCNNRSRSKEKDWKNCIGFEIWDISATKELDYCFSFYKTTSVNSIDFFFRVHILVQRFFKFEFNF